MSKKREIVITVPYEGAVNFDKLMKEAAANYIPKYLVKLPPDVIELFKMYTAKYTDDEVVYAIPFVIKHEVDDVYEMIPYNELSDELLIELFNMKIVRDEKDDQTPDTPGNYDCSIL